MLNIVIFFSIVLTIVIGVAVLLFRWGRRWGFAFALTVSLLAVALSVVMWPIPIHGGFLFLGQVMYNEWSRDREQASQRKQLVSTVRKNLEPRFAGILPFTHKQALPNRWSEVVYDAGSTALLDSTTGLIWSDWSSLESDQKRPALILAKSHCAMKVPQGYWALATTAEEVLMWQARGQELMTETTTNWMSYSTNANFNLEVPSYHLRSPTSNQQPRVGYETFSVHCVARSSTAPEWGFTRDNVDLELWNAYQFRIRQ